MGFSKRITGKEYYWQNIVGGSLYIGGIPPIANGADIRMITVGKDYFMYCDCCERETLMRYQKSKSKETKLFWAKLIGVLTCCTFLKDCYYHVCIDWAPFPGLTYSGTLITL